jgi:LysM repeat protein
MSNKGSFGGGNAYPGHVRPLQAELQRQENLPSQALEYISPPSTSATLRTTHFDRPVNAAANAGYTPLAPAHSANFRQIGVIARMLQAASEQTQHVLTDQVTPLRLAGHLSVLMIAGVVLVLSQITIPNWEINLEPTPIAMAGGSTRSGANQFVSATGFEDDSLTPNSILTIGGKPTSPPTQEAPRPAVEEVLYYNVKPGDTVLGIAEKFGLQPETLMWSNSLIEQNPDRLSIGDQLRILPVDGVLHVVKRGDTLSSIADKYDADMQAVVAYAANAMTSADDALPIGKEIVVPGGTKPFVASTVGASTAYAVSRPDGALAGSGNFSWPTTGYISQGYWGGHPAIDVAGWLGAPVTASDAGYVVLAGGGWNSGYGNYAIIDHGNGFTTLYAHLNSVFVKPGETVSRGQQVGTMGNTGNSTGAHLHFEIRNNGVPYNPAGYLN